MGATPKRFSATRRIQRYAGRLIRINTALNLNFLRCGKKGAFSRVLLMPRVAYAACSTVVPRRHLYCFATCRPFSTPPRYSAEKEHFFSISISCHCALWIPQVTSEDNSFFPQLHLAAKLSDGSRYCRNS